MDEICAFLKLYANIYLSSDKYSKVLWKFSFIFSNDYEVTFPAIKNIWSGLFYKFCLNQLVSELSQFYCTKEEGINIQIA